MDAASAQSQSSYFENLPGELRNRFYRFATVEDEAVDIVAGYCTETKVVSFRQPPLFMVNHKIRGEVLSIYYAENTFNLEERRHGRSETYPVTSPRAFYSCAVAWVRSCHPYAPSIGKVAATQVHDRGPEYPHKEKLVCMVVATIVRNRAEDKVSVRLHNGIAGTCTCLLGQYPAGDTLLPRDVASVATAFSTCHGALLQNQWSEGYWCRVCGGEHPPRHLLTYGPPP